MNAHHLPAWAVAVPLLSAFAAGLAGLARDRRLPGRVALAGLFCHLAVAVGMLARVLGKGTLHYAMSGWRPPLGIEFVADPLASLLVLVISFVALVNALHSRHLVEQEYPGKEPPFYTLYLLLVAALVGLSLTGDAFNLYVMLEIAALTTYGLIALEGGAALLATFHYIIMGTVGATFYLLGVGFLYLKTGSLNMADLSGLIRGLHGSETVVAGFALMIVGLFVKMALFPLHGWLPRAYAEAPHPVSALVAPLSTKVSVFVMIRLITRLFGWEYPFTLLPWQRLVIPLAVLAILVGAAMALAQKDLKDMLVWVIVAEAGYMAGGIWSGNSTGMAGAAFHLLSDALATLCLFLVVGNVAAQRGGHGFRELRGLAASMPLTTAVLVAGGLTVMGVPPTSGFFSKWYLLSGALAGGHTVLAAALVVSGLANAVLFFRVFELAFFEAGERPGPEAPLAMTAPACCATAALLALGLSAGAVYSRIILPVIGVWP